MKLATWNVNGIRSVHQKGFLTWLEKESPDIVCLQEVKSHPEQLKDELKVWTGYQAHWHPAERRGYSGVLTLTRKPFPSVQLGMGVAEFDREGRVLISDCGDFFLLNTYFPNSQRDHARLPYKLKFCDEILKLLRGLAKEKNVLVCGDFNIAHKEIDLKNPKANQDNAGFLPQERAWLDRLVDSGYADTFRLHNQKPENYTWWSYRPTIRERNIGWRLDYFWCDDAFKRSVKSVTHQTEVRGSDHCPVVLTIS